MRERYFTRSASFSTAARMTPWSSISRWHRPALSQLSRPDPPNFPTTSHGMVTALRSDGEFVVLLGVECYGWRHLRVTIRCREIRSAATKTLGREAAVPISTDV